MELEKIFGCSGRVAIVSGGAGLYGFAISEALAEAGATVIVASRHAGQFRQKTAGSPAGARMHHRVLDLMSEESIEGLFSGTVAEFGRVDIVVNNALTPVGGSLAGAPAERWRRSLEGNALGLFLMCRHAAAAMKPRRSGSIINIASIWGVVAPDYRTYDETGSAPNPVDYGFVKGGMVMFTRTLASNLGPDGIRVNCIVPGGIHDETDTPEYVAAYARKVPLGRWALPGDIKGAAIFLASDASSYVTGAVLPVDGGYTAL